MRWDSQERASPQNGALCWLWSTSPSTILGTVGRKEVPRRARFLGLPVLAAVLRIDLAGSDTASACGLVVRGRSPVTKLCRHLVAAAGCDPAEPAETLSRRDPVRKQNVLCPPQ